MTSPNTVKVLFNGFSDVREGKMTANCTCTLVTGPGIVMIVDTMTAWDGERIKDALNLHGVRPSQVTHVVATHGHSDHIGNLNLFLDAVHIVGKSMNKHETYFDVFENDEPLQITDSIKVVPTPGHTESCVSVVVSNTRDGTIAICGDLFENEHDSQQPEIWKDTAGSENPLKQQENRLKRIVPGHGRQFGVTPDIIRLNEENLLKLKHH